MAAFSALLLLTRSTAIAAVGMAVASPATSPRRPPACAVDEAAPALEDGRGGRALPPLLPLLALFLFNLIESLPKSTAGACSPMTTSCTSTRCSSPPGHPAGGGVHVQAPAAPPRQHLVQPAQTQALRPHRPRDGGRDRAHHRRHAPLHGLARHPRHELHVRRGLRELSHGGLSHDRGGRRKRRDRLPLRHHHRPAPPGVRHQAPIS